MPGRRKTFVPLLVVNEAALEHATRLYNAAVAYAAANELEEVMFRG